MAVEPYIEIEVVSTHMVCVCGGFTVAVFPEWTDEERDCFSRHGQTCKAMVIQMCIRVGDRFCQHEELVTIKEILEGRH
jgi:hypothetical protein